MLKRHKTGLTIEIIVSLACLQSNDRILENNKELTFLRGMIHFQFFN